MLAVLLLGRCRLPRGLREDQMTRSSVSEEDQPTPIFPTSLKALLTLEKHSGPGLGALFSGFLGWEGPKAGPVESAAKKVNSERPGKSLCTLQQGCSCHGGEGRAEIHTISPLLSDAGFGEPFRATPAAVKCGKFGFLTRFLVVLKVNKS